MFILQNRHWKSKFDCKNNGKWKLQTCFSQNLKHYKTYIVEFVSKINELWFLKI